MSLSKLFQTDAELEKQGIFLEYGDTRIRVARAGGGNTAYQKRLESVTRPYRRAIQTETLPVDQANGLVMKVFAETVVLGWETKVGDEWKPGMDPIDLGLPPGDLLPMSQERVLEVFTRLPDLFKDVQEQAGKAALFLTDVREHDAKN